MRTVVQACCVVSRDILRLAVISLNIIALQPDCALAHYPQFCKKAFEPEEFATIDVAVVYSL